MEFWQWVLANAAFPIVFSVLILYLWWEKDKNSVPRDVYDGLKTTMDTILGKLENNVTELIHELQVSLDDLGSVDALNTQTLSALKTTLDNLYHLVELCMVVKGGKEIEPKG